MENASNALIIAGGVLIGILIISLAVYLFVDFGSTSAEINKQNEEQQLIQFNTKFTSYQGREDLTIYDVVTVAGYAKENNMYYSDDGENEDEGFVNNYKITVKLKGAIGTGNGIDKNNLQDVTEYNKLIQDEQLDVTTLPKYKCEEIKYHDNGRVSEVTFTKLKN